MFRAADFNGPSIGVIVAYENVNLFTDQELLLTVDQSLAWRVLHRVFIQGNGVALIDWFYQFPDFRLPRLRTVLKLIR